MNHFSIDQLLYLLTAAFFLITSLITYNKSRTTSLVFLFLTGLSIGTFMAMLDPFLSLWDEQFHALVAKNMIKHPFKPMLFTYPLLPYDFIDWTANHIWLHKQPLFLWQMAVSIKLFGLNEFAVRLPSIIMHAIIPLFIYRIGKISLNDFIGFTGGILFCFAYYPLELTAGGYSTDHNDIAFMFYVTGSFWAWFEYTFSGKRVYLVLMAVLSGAAVLVKWLLGLLIYLCAFTANLFEQKNNFKLKSILPLAYSFLLTLVIFIPWQVYIHYQFPAESVHERNYNTRHLFEAIESHGGDALFHFNAIKELYGSAFIIPLLIITGLIIMFIQVKNTKYKVAIFSAIASVYVLYTVAATKMVSYCIVVSPFIFLAIASGINYVTERLTVKLNNVILSNVFKSLIIVTTAFLFLNLPKIKQYHTMSDPNDNRGRGFQLYEKKIIKELGSKLNNGNYVLFNSSISYGGNIPVMFYTNHIAYSKMPTISELHLVRKKGFKTAIFDGGNIPDSLMNDKELLVIPINQDSIQK